MGELRDYSVEPARNSAAPPGGFPENMIPSALNDSMREAVARVRRWFQTIEGTIQTQGSANVRRLTFAEQFTAYPVSRFFGFTSHMDNDGPVTLNINGRGARPLRDIHGAELDPRALRVGVSYQTLYNGVYFVLVYSPGDGAALTDAQIGSKAFRNPPGDLDDAEKTAARGSIDAQVELTDEQIGGKAFRNPPGDLDDAEKTAGRSSIGAGDGTWRNLSGKPDIPSLPPRLTPNERDIGTEVAGRIVSGADLKAAAEMFGGIGEPVVNQNVSIVRSNLGYALNPAFTIPATGFGLVTIVDETPRTGASGSGNLPAFIVPWASVRSVTAHSAGENISSDSYPLYLGYYAGGVELFLGRTSDNELLVGASDRATDPTPLLIFDLSGSARPSPTPEAFKPVYFGYSNSRAIATADLDASLSRVNRDTEDYSNEFPANAASAYFFTAVAASQGEPTQLLLGARSRDQITGFDRQIGTVNDSAGTAYIVLVTRYRWRAGPARPVELGFS